MKKVLVAGLLAICVIALAQQQASAWSNKQFSLNMNWSRQTGGNSICWGAWHNGQPPAPETFHYGAAFPQYYTPTPYAFTPAPAELPMAYQPAYAPPTPTYAPPFQFAINPRPTYYYQPSTFYYGR